MTGLLTYEKWVKDSNPAGEILGAEKVITRTLQKIINRFPRREGTDGWDIPKLHGAWTMGREQLYRHGNADCWNSSHGEHMHQFFFTKLGRQTQRRFASFANQLGERRTEAFACERAVSEMTDDLMPCGAQPYEDESDYDSDTSSDDENTITVNWNYGDTNIPLGSEVTGRGKYTATSDLEDRNAVSFNVTWKDTDKNLLRCKVNAQMLYAIQSYALSKGWHHPISITGFTTIKKGTSRHIPTSLTEVMLSTGDVSGMIGASFILMTPGRRKAKLTLVCYWDFSSLTIQAFRRQNEKTKDRMITKSMTPHT